MTMNLTIIGPYITAIFAEYNQEDATFHNLFIYFCKTLYMFQTGFPSIIRSSKLHIHVQLQAFVRPILLSAASLAGMFLMIDGKPA